MPKFTSLKEKFKRKWDEDQKIEPEFYVPIIPMVLVNGTSGIGTGWSTSFPSYTFITRKD